MNVVPIRRGPESADIEIEIGGVRNVIHARYDDKAGRWRARTPHGLIEAPTIEALTETILAELGMS